MIAGVSHEKLRAIAQSEAATYADNRPRTRAALGAGAAHFLDGVPMHWMKDWPMPFPMLVASAKEASLTDMDGHVIHDFCLGDTGSMFGHSPSPVADAIRDQAANGLTYMLPTSVALEVGELLSRRFGDFRWQIATTATDANRFAIRVARAVTGRKKIIVFNGCYHGTVDDAMVELQDGKTITRPGLLGQVADLTQYAIACEFNDLASVEKALASGGVAAILTEPVMTNSCMVLPQPGFHEGLKQLAERYGTLLIIDETHTISSGPGGYTSVHGLDPDIFVVGKCVAGGMPTSVWGLRADVALRYQEANQKRAPGHSGMGTTLSANPMQFVCLRATLRDVMSETNYAIMEHGAALLEAGLAQAINRHGAPWHVIRVGARVEFICANGPLSNGSEAAKAHQSELEAVIHTCLLNRGCLIAPFHNMMLVSPVTKKEQIERLIGAFDETLAMLFGE
jgi:glutamate-1-semialdehyde 2,1-aminomutase